jgi:hypothetical protein
LGRADGLDRESVMVRVMSEDSRHRAMLTHYVAPSLLSARKKRPKPSPASAPSPLQAARLQLDADADADAAGGAASQGECGRGTQASQAPTQDAQRGRTAGAARLQEAGAACGASQGRKRAFAARPAAGGKENRLPQA